MVAVGPADAARAGEDSRTPLLDAASDPLRSIAAAAQLPSGASERLPGDEVVDGAPSPARSSWRRNEQVENGVRDFRPPPSALGHAVCSAILLGSCLLAMSLIVSEAFQGVRRSVFCKLGPHRRLAPVSCVVPLAGAAVLCNSAVAVGLGFVARFALHSGSAGAGASLMVMERQRDVLQADLRRWRTVSAKILLVSGVAYLLVGAPCAGLAKLALVFLATGFITLYATAIFFDDDFDQAHITPKLLRFLGVYALVGLTFTRLSKGASEKLGDHLDEFSNTNRTHHDNEDLFASAACSEKGLLLLSPSYCTMPLDLAAVVCFWWAASPLFAIFLPARGGLVESGDPRAAPSGGGGGGGGVLGALGSGSWNPRRWLQRRRQHIDLVVLGVTMSLLLLLDGPCRHSSPIAFESAEMGAWIIGLLILFRQASPLVCDGWRGPLEHFPSIMGPVFNPPQCAICIGDLVSGEDICRTPCAHDFHRGCLEDWVWSRGQRSAGCPLCRDTIVSFSLTAAGLVNPLVDL